MARVRISKTPKALSGFEVKMRPGLYGTNGNRQFTLPNQVNSQRFSQQPVDVRDTLQPVAREGANLEAEKGETAMVNIDGVPAHFKIGGKRHSKGGTPLNLPDNSFIFSDTAKMKIKDPMIHAQFGMVPKKSGYTPAEIAKKYDINTFRKILADPNSEDVERKTAEMMISNYNMKLAKLALVQESMKGFPQGIPAVAMPYVMANEINPEELFETQGQEEQPDADMGVSRYGGNMIAQFNTKQYGGLPTAQTGIQQSDDDYYWVNSEGVKFDPMTGQEIDSDELSYFDPKGITKQLGKMKQYLGHDLWKGNPNDISLPPVSGYGEAPTANALAARQMISKLNPYNVPYDGVMGVFDYVGNAINLPLSGINKLTTGKVGTTGNLYTDVLMDPLTYTGLSPVKWTLEAAIKYGPKVGSFIAKHGPKALKYLGKYGDIAVEAIKKYGQKGIDYVIEKTPEIAKQLGKALTSETAQNIGTSLIARGTSGATQEKKKDQKVEKLEKEIAKLKSTPTPTYVTNPNSLLVSPPKSKTNNKSITETDTPQTFNWTTN